VPRGLPDRRFDDSVESAAYFAARESLRFTHGDVTVDAVAENGHLRVVIGADPGFQAAVTQIGDRVGAVGGMMTVVNGKLRLEMPCES
jgi:hypothetical protein